MPNKCCVFGCRSNYDKENEASSFKFPKDPAMREKWIRAINRKDFTPTFYSVVCVKHFAERFIIREDKMTRDDGTLIVAQRARPALTKDAYPSLFPNQPSYLSKELPPERITPKERQARAVARDEECWSNWMNDDKIESFQSFCDNFKKHDVNDWLVITKSEYVSFLRVNCDAEKPNIVVCFKVMSDLTVKLWHRNMPLPMSKLKWLLGTENVCNKWSTFDCLLSHLSSYSDESVTDIDKLECCISILHEILDNIATTENVSLSSEVLWFCAEQLALALQKRKQYSPDFLIWAATVYYHSPFCYKLLRSCGMMNLPHPDYVRKLALKHGKFGAGLENPHILFLKEIFSNLKEKERLVNVLLDEIHVQKRMSYKGGQLTGASTDSTDVATTIQAFMITCPLSSYKYVVALFPVCNLKTDTLLHQTQTVIKVLHGIGFQVLSLISDNNRVNRHMFEKLCGGSLTSFIPNPHNPKDCIFLLFDTVHLLKCIRNNWLNQRDPPQTFVFPSPKNPNIVEHASLSPLKIIHSHERSSYVKLAPALSEKALYPSNLERQNVHYALKVFDEKNIAALKEFQELDSSGTVIFLQQVISWWNIVNVKTPFKGVARRQEKSNPILQTSSHDPNLLFLAEFCEWLDAWELNNPEDKGQMTAGHLSKATHFALRHTTSTLIKLCDYLLEKHKLDFILLGKFQTDKLESRFGLYRQMCGSNYNVSVEQVLESETKLKIVKLLSLKSSKSNVLHIIDMNTSSVEEEEEEEESLAKYVDIFPGIYDDVASQEISHNDAKVLIYISGYVGHTIQKKCKCSLCVAKLCSNNDLDVEISEENSQYTKELNRGGLKWPTESTLNACTITYKIFQVLMSTYEKEYLSLVNHRTVLMNLSLSYLKDTIEIHETCICGTSHKQLVIKTVRSATNILLNNYSKSVNDKLSCTAKAKKRKLSTFSV